MFCIFVSKQWKPFQSQVSRSSEWKTRYFSNENYFYFNLLNLEEKAVPQILQSSAKILQSSAKNGKYKIAEKFFDSMNILDLPATIQLGKIWRRQSTMLKRKENFKRSGI